LREGYVEWRWRRSINADWLSLLWESRPMYSIFSYSLYICVLVHSTAECTYNFSNDIRIELRSPKHILTYSTASCSTRATNVPIASGLPDIGGESEGSAGSAVRHFSEWGSAIICCLHQHASFECTRCADASHASFLICSHLHTSICSKLQQQLIHAVCIGSLLPGFNANFASQTNVSHQIIHVHACLVRSSLFAHKSKAGAYF
jgi:hypothetical protein